MQADNVIIESCLIFSNIGCYEIWRDFSGPLSAVVIAVITVRYAFRQLGAQHQNTLNAQKEESKRNTKIELFRDVSQLLESSSISIRDTSTFCMVKKYSNLDMKAQITVLEFNEILSKFGDALLSIVSKVETHEIVNLKLFRAVRFSLQSIHHDLLKLRSEGDRFLVLERILELTSDAQMYIGDFQVCMQNMAYGDIFDNNVPYRVPADKRYKVITNDEANLDELIKYFWTETDWGKTCAKYEAEAKAKYSS
ncbi:MAG: hypothetical protein Q7U10_03680 [Thermodesulfovibrionia bacterium]|nr:hypothetical protein [Thermodesulfovibrionia bacterium]